MPPNFHLLLYAEECFVKFEVQIFAQIRAALGTTTPAASASSEQVSKAEEFSEDVAEVLEDRRIESGGTARVADSSVPEPVVERPLLGIGKNSVRLGPLFEFIFRIRMVSIP